MKEAIGARIKGCADKLWGQRRNPIAWIIALQATLILGMGIGLIRVEILADDTAEVAEKNSKAIAEINREREDRINAGVSVISFICIENNRQDQALAKLVKVSLPDDGDTFGETVDQGLFSEFDIRVLGTISKVQQLEAEVGTGYQVTFEKELENLEDKTNCRSLAEQYAVRAGLDPSQIKITPIQDVIEQGQGAIKDVPRDSKSGKPQAPAESQPKEKP